MPSQLRQRSKKVGLASKDSSREAATSSVEQLPRAKLHATWLSLLFSSVEILLATLLCKVLPWIFKQPPLPIKDLHGTTTIVSGANGGIGYEIAKQQYLLGSHVILACRNPKRATEAKSRLIQEISSDHDKNVEQDRLEIAILDCSVLASVRSFANSWKESNRGSIDYLFLNAGIVSASKGTNSFTEEGFDLVYVTNHLGPFLLTGLLSPYLSKSARIISTSSAAAYFAAFSSKFHLQRQNNSTLEKGFHYSPKGVVGGNLYSQSKAMQIIFSNSLQAKFDLHGSRSKITAAYHPGFVATNIFTSINLADLLASIAPTILKIVALTCKQGAQGALWLALSETGFQPGGFYDRGFLISYPWYDSVSSRGVPDRLWKRWNADAGLEESDWHF